MRKITVAAVIVILAGLARYGRIGPMDLTGSRVAVAATDTGAGAPASQPGTTASRPASTRPAEGQENAGTAAAMRRAAEVKRHLFVFVYEKNDDQMRAGRKIFDSALGKLGDAAQWTTVDRTASSEKDFVARYGLKSAPMPVVLVFAPNGALAGGFVGARLTEALLLDSLASPAKQACLKGLQDRKLVFLCVRSGAAKSDEGAAKGVNEFKADERFAESTEIVHVNHADNAEAKFLAQLEIDPKAEQATTVFLAPPSIVIGKYTGVTEKSKLVSALQAASSGGCSGKSGCCPISK